MQTTTINSLKQFLKENNFKKTDWYALSNFAYDFFQQHPEIDQFGQQAPQVIVTIKASSFNKEYSEISRSYIFSLAQKYFMPSMSSNSIFANCLDGTDNCIRLDHYLFDAWKLENVYLQKLQ